MNDIEKIKKSIGILSGDLSELQDPFYIIGSSALVLAGVPLISTDDIDLLTSYRDADFLKSCWETNKIRDYEPNDSDKFRSNFGRFQLGKILAEVMGDLEVFENGQWQKLQIQQYYDISTGQLTIRIPTLQEQERIFRLFGRPKDLIKADLILKHIIQPKNGN